MKRLFCFIMGHKIKALELTPLGIETICLRCSEKGLFSDGKYWRELI